eukprot:CAMPEP_0198313984 /NCGR_PEP_ID=MMETSP1450-20131203/4826_1 /TAXON_ID=753684 ORGANISM="Madagascaria erythrocladiodes, Strain CCMP3234" /NCGR_SAMPLE_ID=MMETSP1450 /ASSEMBLY_ACC=CAM_ASM_001115 /LENGTH=255 /DNA_ID=CAMNT_0044017017 /DNA_START=276 /DNA_END=1043 /DNA_ORIENTATION=-
MDAEKLKSRHPKGRKAICPIVSGVPAYVEDWALSFDLFALPPNEPAMAGAVRKTGSRLHGILYKLSAEDYETLALTEGAMIPNSSYMEEVVEAQVEDAAALGGSRSVKATVFALRYPPQVPLVTQCIYPSERYLKLLIKGCRDADLPTSHLSALEAHPVARPSPSWMKGYARLGGIGIFNCYRMKYGLVAIRHAYKPLLQRLFALRERAFARRQAGWERLWNTLFLCYLLPFVFLGLLIATFQRKPVWKILSGQA